MQMNRYPGTVNFGLLPEPEGRTTSFITASTVNVIILGLVIYIGITAKRAIQQHKFEQTELIFPTTPPPEVKVKTPPPPKLPPPPKPVEVKLEAPKINMPKIEPKPALKPIEMEAKLNTPQIKAAKPAIVLAPQPKAALTAAMPAQIEHGEGLDRARASGRYVWRDPESERQHARATVAAIGNPYGGMQGPAVAPHGVVGSTGIGRRAQSPDRMPERSARLHPLEFPAGQEPRPPAALTRRQGCFRGNSDADGDRDRYSRTYSAGG